MKKKILVVDDDPKSRRNLKRNIKKFDVIAVATIAAAIKVLAKGEISFLVLDLKLKGASRGYTVLSKAFFKGWAVPGILITGYQLSTADKNYLKSLGALEILQKGGGKGTMSSRVQKTVEKHLIKRNSKFVAIDLRIKRYRIATKPMSFDGKTKSLSEWLSYLKRANLSIEKEDEVVKQIYLVANRLLLHHDTSDYIFPQI